MTGYRCWHDIDTISTTSRCRRCKRGMTRYRCWHDIDTISSASQCRRYRKNIVNWTYLKEKGRDLTQSYSKSTYTNRNVKRAKWNTNKATNSSITQRLRTDLRRSVGVTTATQLVWLTSISDWKSSALNLMQRKISKCLRRDTSVLVLFHFKSNIYLLMGHPLLMTFRFTILGQSVFLVVAV